ncbi:MAG TPA: hypothetical protein VM621_05185 [Luteibacter sp.]|uniref:hypothetical protein n=1 Tax=Luteibacter sp. TaxID=1886636 RepID=UPI002C577D24|nr:hypothetical protein [Luteibacter sp.]HVI54429.1 hypothetical protein [Luteibacter sp.]
MKYETSTCYHCDAVATGREHVPARCLFPGEKDWNRLMTVPSCRLHNNATSAADDYLKFLLGAISPNVPDAIRSSTESAVIIRKSLPTRSSKGQMLCSSTWSFTENSGHR